MSADEDTELRDLVAGVLETNGVLGKMRAQLRASVFLALEEQDASKNIPLVNKKLQTFVNTREGRLVASLVREFLEYFDLDYTMTVYESEAGLNEVYDERPELARELDIIESDATHQKPLLAEFLNRSLDELPHRSNHQPGFHGDHKPAMNDTISQSKDTEAPDTLKSDSELPPLPPTSTRPPGNSPLLNGTSVDGERVFSGADQHSDPEDDSFFDDPVPEQVHMQPTRDQQESVNKDDQKLTADLLEYEDSYNPSSKNDVNPAKGSSVIRLDTGDDNFEQDYDDDFDSEKISSVSKSKQQSGVEGGAGAAPGAPMASSGRPLAKDSPRSVRSDSTNVQSIEEEIEEELDANDLLTENSEADDLTTDHTVSPREQNKLFDYSEDVGGKG